MGVSTGMSATLGPSVCTLEARGEGGGGATTMIPRHKGQVPSLRCRWLSLTQCDKHLEWKLFRQLAAVWLTEGDETEISSTQMAQASPRRPEPNVAWQSMYSPNGTTWIRRGMFADIMF